MIIASIAMEELALSHILNAEGEKLQYILGTLPGKHPCASSQDVLAVNRSVTALVEAVTQNQMLLKNKLDQVLEFCPLPPRRPEPCPPSCPPEPCPPACPPPDQARPCKKTVLQLTGHREGMLWHPGCRLPWKQRNDPEKDTCWDEHAPAQIRLNPQKAYTVRYTLNVCARPQAEGTGIIFLRQSPRGAFSDTLPLCFSMEDLTRGPRTLRHTAVLYPRTNGGCEAELSLVLDARGPLCVEQAVIDVTEI